MKGRQRQGRRYLAGLAILFAIVFLAVGTLGPAHRSPYYWAIVPLPAAVAVVLGWLGWSRDRRSTGYSTAALLLLVLVLLFSHLLPRSHP